MDEGQEGEEKMRHILEIKPGIVPAHRHKIEDALKACGYLVRGGGQMVDLSCSDISFDSDDNESCGEESE